MARTRPRGTIAFVYAIVAYAAFLTATAWAVTFLADLQLPRGIDHGARHRAALAVVIDLALLLLFAVQHSVMARANFKCWMARWTPALTERSTYVLMASLALLLVFWQWQPVGGSIWDLPPVASDVTWGVFAFGWLVSVSSTFMVDHFDFFGLRRVYRHARHKPYTPAPFQERWLYAWIRHPLMLGLLLAFWATPRLTAGHLLFAGAATGYIAVGLRFEERDLVQELGESYVDYSDRVPALLPLRRSKESRRPAMTVATLNALPVENAELESARSSIRLTSRARPCRGA